MHLVTLWLPALGTAWHKTCKSFWFQFTAECFPVLQFVCLSCAHQQHWSKVQVEEMKVLLHLHVAPPPLQPAVTTTASAHF